VRQAVSPSQPFADGCCGSCKAKGTHGRRRRAARGTPAGKGKDTHLEHVLLRDRLVLGQVLVTIGKAEIENQALEKIGPVDARRRAQAHRRQIRIESAHRTARNGHRRLGGTGRLRWPSGLPWTARRRRDVFNWKWPQLPDGIECDV
jgi:hypothetical protein